MAEAMTYDWAMLEALEEVDAIGWAAPSVAPPKYTGPDLSHLAGQANAFPLAMLAGQMQLVNEPIEAQADRDRAHMQAETCRQLGLSNAETRATLARLQERAANRANAVGAAYVRLEAWRNGWRP